MDDKLLKKKKWVSGAGIFFHSHTVFQSNITKVKLEWVEC